MLTRCSSFVVLISGVVAAALNLMLPQEDDVEDDDDAIVEIVDVEARHSGHDVAKFQHHD